MAPAAPARKTLRISIYAPSITEPEHRSLRNAIDAASVSGETTFILNSASAPIAAIVPLGIEELGRAEWARQTGRS
jgi:hypothetical protein